MTRTTSLTTLAMMAFASNSLLCRIALQHPHIDAVSFTVLRLVSGAVVLGVLGGLRGGTSTQGGSWLAAMALFAYAACFSLAYLSLPAGTGALLLFGAVQITMIGYGLFKGEQLRRWQWLGLLLALAGLVGLLKPGLTAPPLSGALLMLGAGIAWGIYSLLGRGVAHPTRVTAGNFVRAVPLALILALGQRSELFGDSAGVVAAIASGALTSGLGYAVWYAALPRLKATQAATVQLSVPILAAIGAIGVLHEPITLQLGLAAMAVLGGIALVIRQSHPRPRSKATLPSSVMD